jgi:hypothetical protein
MAYAQPRSANRELEQGMVDGSYKMVVKDRGGVVEEGTWYKRDDLSCVYYGIIEAPVMDTPDGQKCTPLYHTDTPMPQLHNDLSLSGVTMYGGR